MHTSDLYRDLAQHRASDPDPVSVGETSPMFGALMCCFVFAAVFVSLGWGLPS